MDAATKELLLEFQWILSRKKLKIFLCTCLFLPPPLSSWKGLEYIFLVAGKALHWNGKARMRSFFSERNFFFSAINSFFFEIWIVVKTERSEVLAVQIEKKKELIKEKKIFLKEKKSIRDLSLKIATFFSY